MKKRFLSILLATAMTVSLAACGSESSDVKQQQSAEQEASTKEQEVAVEEQEKETTEEFDPTAAYDETVTLEIAMYNKTDLAYEDGDDVTNNPWTRSYKERFNVEVVPSFIAEPADYSTKINLAIAEGNLPDVCLVTATQLKQLVEADMLYDMTEVYELYANDAVRKYYEMDPETYESGIFDDKLYALAKLSYGPIAQLKHIWIRADWKEALNLEDPETMNDVLDIVKAFSEEYGSEAIIPVDSSLDLLYLLAPAWGAYPNIWVDDGNGQIVYGATQPAMKEALTEWAEWYREGIISENFATTNLDNVFEDAVNGKIGLMPYYNWWGWTPGTDVITEQGADAHFEPYAIPVAADVEVLHPLNADNYGYMVVSKDCEHPEAVMKLINFHAYMEEEALANGESEDVVFAHNSVAQAAYCLAVLNPQGETEGYLQLSEAVEKRDTSVITDTSLIDQYNECLDWEDNQTPASFGRYIQRGPGRTAYGVAYPILNEGKVIKNKVWINKPDSMLEVGSTLDDILLEGFTKIIMGEESIDYFDILVENWKTAGGERVTNDVNAMYQ